MVAPHLRGLRVLLGGLAARAGPLDRLRLHPAFAVDPQKRFMNYQEQVLLLCLFPGAFATAVLPLYAALFFALMRGW